VVQGGRLKTCYRIDAWVRTPLRANNYFHTANQIFSQKKSMEIAKQVWSYSVVVSTRDFESRDLGSNPGKT